jgi:aspartyl-tRNA(Asn)/glutamyl-tRNA(Gln) amidotransferase subunit A
MSFVELRADKYVTLSARALGQMVAERQISPVQLAELALALAKEAEPRINAYVSTLDPWARQVAGEREREVREGRSRSPLHGVPIAVKDNFYLRGFPLGRGSRTDPGYVPNVSAPMVERLLDAGAVIIGKTTTPEFGWKGTGISPLTGVTRNPWNTERNSGGSSAGSAATVAAGAVPIATGTDAGGSVRIPAAFCGVAGFKPTLGRIPVWPGTVTETLSHAGPLTRFVDDIALTLDLTAYPDSRDPLSYAATGPGDAARWDRLREGALRIGIISSPFGIPADGAVAKVFDAAITEITGQLGAQFSDAAIDAPLPRDVFETLWVTGRGIGYAELFSKEADIMDPGLVRLGPLSAAYSLAEYFDAIRKRRSFISAAFKLFDSIDLALTPTMPIVAFDAASEVPPGGEADAPLPWITWTPYTYPFNISGQPAMSLPCGLAVDGMPIGLQVIGPWGSDELVLAFARQVETVLGFRDRQTLPIGPLAYARRE